MEESCTATSIALEKYDVSVPQEEGEDEGRVMRMGKQLLRSLALGFGCIVFASLMYDLVIESQLYKGYKFRISMASMSGN
ncbi:hypothetical protein L1987_06837 [Smallanthus sonchifolius]|uniref:Uncharacterized protein n=1 Tax=Smallanthus sonchifolius TaxID=185202 RepID=A0ACB9JZD0_9ASTR|nr:hypothetical protein L1987_06837 [Smallanthus sonchifolius]